MQDWIITTNRLQLRRISAADRNLIAPILRDPETMYAWEHGFSEQEIDEWLERNFARYAREGHSFWLAFDRHTNNCIGCIGLIIEHIQGQDYLGIGYILDKQYWGQGYALDGANGCLQYAFDQLEAERVYAQIRPTNKRSCRVAEKLGMHVEFEYVKVYQGHKMPHLVYMIDRN